KKLRKTVMKIVTNSQGIEEPKDPDSCSIFALYKLFATPEQQEKLAARYRAGGMGWGEAKQELFEVMNAYLKPMREKYFSIMENKDEIDRILKEGSDKARQVASRTVARVRKAIGVNTFYL
ncbi:TPA: tryptophan--tRNA ligase, partial [Candidatus Marinimicrobia bacterium]